LILGDGFLLNLDLVDNVSFDQLALGALEARFVLGALSNEKVEPPLEFAQV
jgi:hypothetical protein